MNEIKLNVAGAGNDGGMLVRLDDVKSMFQSQQERIAELEAEVSAWSDLWDEAMNAVQRCARKEAWHDEHPLLGFNHTKAIREQVE